MVKLLLLVVLSAFCAVTYAKHIHPRNIIHMDTEEESVNDIEQIPTDIDGMTIEVLSHMKPSRFVPVNNMLFFTRYPPCEEGFKRDLFGDCREVWE